MMNPNNGLNEMTTRREQSLSNGRLYDFQNWDLPGIELQPAVTAQTENTLLEDPVNSTISEN